MEIHAVAVAVFFGLLVATSIVATVRTIVRDGHRRVRTRESLLPVR
jgi:hypothetical protein